MAADIARTIRDIVGKFSTIIPFTQRQYNTADGVLLDTIDYLGVIAASPHANEDEKNKIVGVLSDLTDIYCNVDNANVGYTVIQSITNALGQIGASSTLTVEKKIALIKMLISLSLSNTYADCVGKALNQIYLSADTTTKEQIVLCLQELACLRYKGTDQNHTTFIVDFLMKLKNIICSDEFDRSGGSDATRDFKSVTTALTKLAISARFVDPKTRGDIGAAVWSSQNDKIEIVNALAYSINTRPQEAFDAFIQIYFSERSGADVKAKIRQILASNKERLGSIPNVLMMIFALQNDDLTKSVEN